MASKYSSSTETTNFARLSRLVVDICSDVYRAVLKANIPPPGLTAILLSQKVHLCNHNHLENRQKQLLYPVGGVFTGTLKDLDFSLLYRLIRNLQGINIPPQTKGWGKPPNSTDRSLAANIDRLRVQRNEAYGHLQTASLSDTEFKDRWDIIRQSISEIEQDTLTGDTYVTAVDNLLTTSMDPNTENEYIQELQKHYKADLEVKTIALEVKENIGDVTARQQTMAENISDVTARQQTMAENMDDVRVELTSVRDTLNTTSASTSRTKEVHPNLVPLIDTTKAMINEEIKKRFIDTQAFRDGKEKLQKNRIAVLKGNTGDGKTSTAIRLLHWLSQEQHNRQPVQLHNIKDLDLLAPSSKTVIFIDDIFGEKDLREKEVQEWNKRVNSVTPKLCGDDPTEANFILITVRNEIFNSLKTHSLADVFTDVNIIDLSADTYKVTEEKNKLLELYKPSKFSWEKEEKEEIVKCAPNIGFPQCCRIFRDVPEVQKERVKFFQNPFHFFKSALSRLRECPALLFLFLNDGMIKVKDLDPYGDKVNEALLEETFATDLIDGEDNRTMLEYKKKVRFVKDSLDRLSGFLVVKEKHRSFDYEVYRFYHDSIYVTVALLYGDTTPVGYIQNCPTTSLSYLTTSKTSANMIVISSDHYTCMCDRLLREFECKEKYYDTSIGSLDVWKDPVFVEGFVRLLNERNADKLGMLNKACSLGAEECALYLLCEGVKPDNNTPFCVVEGGGVSVLPKLLQYDIIPTWRGENNYNVLHEACWYRREEMVSVLCDTYPHLVHDTDKEGQTPLYVVAKTGSCSMFQTVERTVLKSLCRFEDKQHKCEILDGRVIHRSCVCSQYMSQLVDNDGHTVLHESCMFGNREVCVYLCETFPALTTAVDNRGQTVLHESCESGHREVCVYLCETFPALTKAVDKYGQTVLHMSCMSGHREVCVYLCETFPALTTAVNNDGQTVLHVSCMLGHREVCVYLCETFPALTKAVDKDGLTVLHVSCMSGHREVCVYLCETFPALTTAVDNDGLTVLHVSCLYGHREVCVYLCETFPALTTAVDNDGQTVLHVSCLYGHREVCVYLCETFPALTTAVDNDGQTVLHASCLHGYREVCVYLCETFPALTTAVDYRGQTVLHVSCLHGHREVCVYLCETFPTLTTAVDIEGLTVLHVSCLHGHREVCVYLCETFPALTTAVDNRGQTVLHVSCESGHREVCVYLCETFLTLTTAVDNRGQTVLHVSCLHGHREVCVYLCETFPTLTTAVDNDGQTVLHVSCESGHREVCVYLCETFPALTTAVDNRGRTVLHVSCMSGHREVCVYLCETFPALTKAVDKDGLTVLHVSCESRHREVVFIYARHFQH
ncbi:uncharacterized protein LOC117327700 isoform X2 [Pecten maximus]|uniref:uncharacterized protein LOC117327700 isoform X2 n=1 Tax=Pecten maximus TaxID=6579 RepID=UPI0014582741|nr:uncharacterized protein LOC117327700 isoform X2 [Pecten maximus]